MLVSLAEYPQLQNTITVFLAIVVEAVPFVTLGVLVSLLLARFVSGERLLALVPEGRVQSHVVSACLGMIFPVCECGNVPVMRSLIERGFSLSQAISFYLGAPILNVAVIASTYAAFSNYPVVFWGRFLLGLLIAVLVGVAFSFLPDQQAALTDKFAAQCERVSRLGAGGSHSHSHGHGHSHSGSRFGLAEARHFAHHFARDFREEFMPMFNYLLLGAAIAAFTQIWIPRDFVFAVAAIPLLATLGMMLLAVVISVCSTVDAFIALGFAQVFPAGALLGFLLFGPMIDIKAISMLTTSFKLRFIALLVALTAALTIISSLTVTVLGF